MAMKKVAVKTKSKEVFKPIDRVEALFEHMQSDIKAVLESQSIVIKKLDDIDTKLEEHDSKFETIFTHFLTIDERLDRIEVEIKEIKKRIIRTKRSRL